jgi:hypothetical protein
VSALRPLWRRVLPSNLCARFTDNRRILGSFYGNVTLLGTNLEAVRAVSPRPAFVLADGDAIVVFAEVDDEGVPRSGEELSAALDCIAVSVAIHDDDIFFFEVHDSGRSVVSGAVPDPAAFFGIDAEMMADIDPSMRDRLELPAVSDSGGLPDSGLLVGAVRRGDVDAVRTAFESDFVFATERHQAIAEALGLPLGAVGWGYGYLSREDNGYEGPVLVKI